jgi:hypothetical protein
VREHQDVPGELGLLRELPGPVEPLPDRPGAQVAHLDPATGSGREHDGGPGTVGRYPDRGGAQR